MAWIIPLDDSLRKNLSAGSGFAARQRRSRVTIQAVRAIGAVERLAVGGLVVHALDHVPHAEWLHPLVALFPQRPSVDHLVHRKIGAETEANAEWGNCLFHRRDDRRVLREMVEQH